MHSAPAESGYLTRGEQARDRLAGIRQYPPGQVGLQPAEGLAGDDVQPHRDQRAGPGIEDLVRGGGADEAFAERPARVADRHDLHVLA